MRSCIAYQFLGLLERSLGLVDGCFPRLAVQLGDLVELLCQVGLYELELGLVAAKQLRAGIGVEGVRHLVGLVLADEAAFHFGRSRAFWVRIGSIGSYAMIIMLLVFFSV